MLVTRYSLAGLPVLDAHQVFKSILTQTPASLQADPVLQADYNAFQTAFNNLDALINAPQASVLTPQLLALDAERDNYLAGLRDAIKGFTKSPATATKEAALLLQNKMNAYGIDVAGLPQREESSAIGSLLQDFAQPDATAALARVPVQDWITALQTLNTQFEQLYNNRVNTTAVQEAGMVRTARKEAQAALRTFVTRLNALITLSATPTPDQQAAAAMINAQVENAFHTHRVAHRNTQAPNA